MSNLIKFDFSNEDGNGMSQVPASGAGMAKTRKPRKKKCNCGGGVEPVPPSGAGEKKQSKPKKGGSISNVPEYGAGIKYIDFVKQTINKLDVPHKERMKEVARLWKEYKLKSK